MVSQETEVYNSNTTPIEVSGIMTATSIALGSAHSYALLMDGEVLCCAGATTKCITAVAGSSGRNRQFQHDTRSCVEYHDREEQRC